MSSDIAMVNANRIAQLRSHLLTKAEELTGRINTDPQEDDDYEINSHNADTITSLVEAFINLR